VETENKPKFRRNFTEKLNPDHTIGVPSQSGQEKGSRESTKLMPNSNQKDSNNQGSSWMMSHNCQSKHQNAQTGLRLFNSIHTGSRSLTSAALPTSRNWGHVSGPKQTGQTLQLYITKGWTENPINKSTRSRFSTTKPSSRDDENIFFYITSKTIRANCRGLPPKQLC